MFRINNSPKLYAHALKIQYIDCHCTCCPGKRDDNMCAHYLTWNPSICSEINLLDLAEFLFNYTGGILNHEMHV